MSSPSSTSVTCPYAKIVAASSPASDNDTASHGLPIPRQNDGGDNRDDDANANTNEHESPSLSVEDEHHARQVREALELARTSCPAFQQRQQASSSDSGIKCPFREAHSAEELRRAMLTVPPSHLRSDEGSGGGGGTTTSSSPASSPVSEKFRLALEHVHAVSQSIHHHVSGDGTSQHLPLLPNPNDDGKPGRKDTDASTNSPRKGTSYYVLDGGCPFKMFYRKKNSDIEEDDVPFVQAMEGYSLSAIMGQLAAELEREEEEQGAKSSGSGAKGAAVDTIHDSKSSAIVEPAAPSKTTQGTTADKPAATTSSQQQQQQIRLSSALKRGTTSSHRAAENVHFVRNFIKGNILLDLYKQLVCNLYHVYTALEEELDVHAPSSVFASLHKPEQLDRRGALREDMSYFFGTDWTRNKNAIKMSVATQDYVNRLHYVATHRPLLLLAHAYTRYLGDLSGGRVLQRVARKALTLPPDGSGLKFYNFDDITEGPKAFKAWYRTTLDGLPLTERDVRLVVAEANVAFVLNMRMFEELDVLEGVDDGAEVRPLQDALEYYDRALREEEEDDMMQNKAGGKCPFATVGKGKEGGKDAGDAKAKGKCPASGKGARKEEEEVAKQQDGDTTTSSGSSRCPWPFVFFHDPAAGMKDVQTWVVLCALCLWAYRAVLLKGSSSGTCSGME